MDDNALDFLFLVSDRLDGLIHTLKAERRKTIKFQFSQQQIGRNLLFKIQGLDHGLDSVEETNTFLFTLGKVVVVLGVKDEWDG